MPGRNGDWTDIAEEVLNRDDNFPIAEGLCEDRQELLLYPINLNRATAEQLESCGLFTPYQVHSIISYRDKYGDLLSVYELASLSGFRKQRLEKQAIYMTVGETVRSNPVSRAGTRILVFAGSSLTNTKDQVLYPGSPLKSSLRMKTGVGKRVRAGLAYEKDQGERGLWEYGPEHLTGYFEVNGPGILENIIFGNYRINNGMGLIQGAGLMHTPEAAQSRPLLLSSLKPYAGAGESIIHQGAACKLNLGITKVMLWSSFQNTDLSLANPGSASEETDWSEFIRETGMHRTANEIAGRNLGYLGCAGIQVLVNTGKLILGTQYSVEINGLTTSGKDSLRYFGGPALYHSSSIQWGWRLGRMELYGEFAPGQKNSSALMGGGRFFINDFLSGLVQLHWYGTAHRETFASAYASGSHILNEQGLLILIRAEPFREVRADFSVELYKYPAPRTLVRVPSSGYRYNLTLNNGSLGKLQWRLRTVLSSRQQTPSADLSGIRPLSIIQNSRVDGRLIYKPLPGFSWQSRLVISYTSGNASRKGHATLQQVNFRLNKKLRATLQFVMFHVPCWDNRIYLYEPGLYQQFRFPVYSGTGNKLSMLASLKPMRGVTLEAKGSVCRQDEIEKWEVGIQLRLNF